MLEVMGRKRSTGGWRGVDGTQGHARRCRGPSGQQLAVEFIPATAAEVDLFGDSDGDRPSDRPFLRQSNIFACYV